jgi:hypothetical protein
VKPALVATGTPGPPHRPFPDPRRVAMAGEADLAELRVAQAQLHRRVPNRATGRAPPAVRSWPVPWLPPAGADGRGDDVLDAVPRAHPAVVARGPAAIGDPACSQRRLPVVPQEVLVEPGRECAHGSTSPRSRWRCTYQSSDRPSAVQRVGPSAQVEVLAPLLERAAGPPHPLDHPPMLGRRG